MLSSDLDRNNSELTEILSIIQNLPEAGGASGPQAELEYDEATKTLYINITEG